MSTEARHILEAARALPPKDQLEILQGLAQSLARVLSPLASSTASFWDGPSIEDIVREQNISPVTDPASLKSSAWPEDESVDEFLDYVYDQRSADRDR